MSKHHSKVTKGKKRPSAKTNQKIIFYAVAFFIPIVFLLVFEILLRLLGFGQSFPLFIENPAHTDYLLARPDVMKRYFPYSKNVPTVTMETDFFLAKKPENGIRIFVQGGSTAAGFPYGLGASLSGTLEQRLRQSMPNHRVELINTAMSAVNSHTLLDLADDIIEQDPDMILIYAGHNEFLGVLGATSNFASSSSFWLTRAMLSLKELRLFQLLQWLYAAFESSPEQATNMQSSSSMMAQVAANQSIELDSSAYKAGLHQFETNIGALLAKYKAKGIPVLIANIASNHSGQAPFKSSEVEPEFSALVSTLNPNANISVKEFEAASSALEKSRSALLHYELGKLSESRNQFDLAAKHYELAVANDLLKFRASAQMNKIIERLAAKHGAQFVDALAYFKARSPHGIVGDELMLEHLHPNLRGYYVISEAFYTALSDGKYFSPWTDISINKAWPQRLILPSEEYHGFASILKLKSAYPFVASQKQLSLPKPEDKAQDLGLQYFTKQIDWLTMLEQNLSTYRQQNNDVMTLKCLQILSDALPNNALYAVQAAEKLEHIGQKTLARHYYQRALLAGLMDKHIELQ